MNFKFIFLTCVVIVITTMSWLSSSEAQSITPGESIRAQVLSEASSYCLAAAHSDGKLSEGMVEGAAQLLRALESVPLERLRHLGRLEVCPEKTELALTLLTEVRFVVGRGTPGCRRADSLLEALQSGQIAVESEPTPRSRELLLLISLAVKECSPTAPLPSSIVLLRLAKNLELDLRHAQPPVALKRLETWISRVLEVALVRRDPATQSLLGDLLLSLNSPGLLAHLSRSTPPSDALAGLQDIQAGQSKGLSLYSLASLNQLAVFEAPGRPTSVQDVVALDRALAQAAAGERYPELRRVLRWARIGLLDGPLGASLGSEDDRIARVAEICEEMLRDEPELEGEVRDTYGPALEHVLTTITHQDSTSEARLRLARLRQGVRPLSVKLMLTELDLAEAGGESELWRLAWEVFIALSTRGDADIQTACHDGVWDKIKDLLRGAGKHHAASAIADFSKKRCK